MPYLRPDRIKTGMLLRSKEDGSLALVLCDTGNDGYRDFVLVYDFKKRKRIQLNASYIHADIVGGNDGQVR